MRALRWTATVAVLAMLAACAPTPPSTGGSSGAAAGPATQAGALSLEGRWIICLSESTRSIGPLCAPLTATLRRGERPQDYYQVEHDVRLDSLLRTAHQHPRFGVLAPADSGRWRLLLGVDEGVVNAFDVGLHGELAGNADSLAGTWTHSCFAGCPEQGRVVLRR